MAMTAGRPAGRGKWRSGAWYAARPLRFLEYRAGSDCPYSGFNSSGSSAMLAAIRRASSWLSGLAAVCP